MKLTVHGSNSHETIDTQNVELKLTPAHSGGSCPAFVVKAYVRKDFFAGSEVIDNEFLQVQYPHLESIPPKKHSYGDVETILGQFMFHCIRPLEHFETRNENIPKAIRLPLGWVLSGPLPSTLCLFSICFKVVLEEKLTQT